MSKWSTVSLAVLIAAAGVALAGNNKSDKNSRNTPNNNQTGANSLTTPAANSDLFDAFVNAGNCKTFVAAIKAAGLEQTFRSKEIYTVFAPTDEAFGKLPPGTVELLLKPENKEHLANILKFHVLPGKINFRDVSRMQESSQTLLGQTFGIENRDGKVWVGTNQKLMGAIVKQDFPATNGVVHFIDAVMMPRQ